MLLVVTNDQTNLTENGHGNLPPVLGDVESSPRSDGDRGWARGARQRGSRRADVCQDGRPRVVARLGRERHQVGRGGALLAPRRFVLFFFTCMSGGRLTNFFFLFLVWFIFVGIFLVQGFGDFG